MYICVTEEKIMHDVVEEWLKKFPEEAAQFFQEEKFFRSLEAASGRDEKGFSRGRSLMLEARIPARIIKGVEIFTQDPKFWTKKDGKNIQKFARMFPAFSGKDTGWRPR